MSDASYRLLQDPEGRPGHVPSAPSGSRSQGWIQTLSATFTGGAAITSPIRLPRAQSAAQPPAAATSTTPAANWDDNSGSHSRTLSSSSSSSSSISAGHDPPPIEPRSPSGSSTGWLGGRPADAQQSTQDRMVSVLLQRHRIKICAFMGVGLCVCACWAILFMRAVAALLVANRTCDQPLNYYLPCMFAVSHTSRWLEKWWQHYANNHGLSMQAKYWFVLVSSLPGWILIGWGCWMVQQSRTCQSTDPGLFYPTRDWIYFQVLLAIFSTLFFSIGFRCVLLRIISAMEDSMPGCETAVRSLPTVPSDDSSLVDEDGGQKDCCICTDILGQPDEASEIVRTPCRHFFHRECLALWCKTHLECPICRSPVGQEDRPHMAGTQCCGCWPSV